MTHFTKLAAERGPGVFKARPQRVDRTPTPEERRRLGRITAAMFDGDLSDADYALKLRQILSEQA